MRGVRVGVGVLVVLGAAVVAPPPAPAAVESAVVINELHYHGVEDDQDFLELHNPTGADVALGGACFTAGISGCFAEGTTLPAGGFVLAAEDPAAVAAAFPDAPAVALDHGGSLSNGGERVTLSLGSTVLDTVEYDDAGGWPTTPDGDGPSLELVDPAAENDEAAAWLPSDPGPTPGAPNTRLGAGPAPTIGAVEVGTVTAGEPTTVTAAVTGAEEVALEVVVGFAPPTEVAMADGGGGLWSAAIPAQPAGTLVRYRVVASSAEGRASLPADGDARARRGFVVAPPAPPSPLPLLQWFIGPGDWDTLLQNRHTNDYVPSVLAYGSEVWDGVEVRVQGNSRNVAKLSFKLKMPGDHLLVAPGLVEHPVDELVLDGDRLDAMGTSALVGLDAYADGNPFVPQRAKVRVHRNGDFAGVFTFLEEWDDGWLDRAGLDVPGAEVYEPEDNDGALVDEGSVEALEARFEQLAGSTHEPLHQLVQVVDSPPTPERAARLRDLFDVPALVEFLATGTVLQHWDQGAHNWLLLRDPATGRWRFAPTDLDNTLGQPVIKAPDVGARHPHVFAYGPAELVSAIRTDPVLTEMYFRRLRSRAEELLTGGELEADADALAPLVAADVEADRQLFGAPFTAAPGRANLGAWVDFKAQDLLVARRRAGEVPPAATPGRAVVVSELAYAATGGPGRDMVELHNPSDGESVDLSGWTLSGAATATLPPGTVLPAGGYLVVPGDPQLLTAPSGTVVAGALADGVADGGGTVEVRDAEETLRGQAAYGTTAPWPTAPASGTATLELVDPSTAPTGPTSWRASPAPAGSPGGSGNPAGPPPEAALAVEAAADQSEVRPADGAGTRLTVAVTNPGTQSRPAVTVAAAGTTCGRSLGTLAPGATTTYRCRSLAHPTPDRTYLVTATSGSVVALAPPVQVRTQRLTTQAAHAHLPAAPTAPEGAAAGGGRLVLTWTSPPPTPAAPHRWAIVTELGPDRAVPTGGTRWAPTDRVELDHLPLDQPVRLGVAVRNLAGTGPRTPPTPALTPRASSTFPFPDVDTAVRTLLRAVDGRPPSALQVSLWTATLQTGTSPSAIVVNGLAAPRWADDVAPVARLYTAYFGRLPDQPGLAHWVARRRAGVGLDVVSSAFARTAEFRARYGTLDDVAFVTQLYRNVFGREPDAPGRAYWVQRLRTGTSRGRVVTSFSESAEGRRLLAPSVQTSLVWTALLGATPRASEAQPAIDWLAEGGSLLTVVEGVRTSDRYAEHVAP